MSYAEAWVMAFIIPTMSILSVGVALDHWIKFYALFSFVAFRDKLFHLSMTLFFYLAGLFFAMVTFKLWHNLLI